MSHIERKAIRDYARKRGMMISSDFYYALDKKIEQIIESAARRASDNKRKTLKAYDL